MQNAVLEVAILHVVAGDEESFESAFAEAEGIIASTEGYIGHELQRCIEQPNQYVLLVRWRALDDHIVGFRQSAGYQQWKVLLHHFYDPFPIVEHYIPVTKGGHYGPA
jgi:heme-degrading monooxygenase HmoA